MDDVYETVSVHGTMPIVIDARTGELRFARIGIDMPSECLVSPEGLPEAEIDLFVFSGSDKLAVWSSAIREVASNAVEVIVPDVQWPRFALLVRHGRVPRQAATLEEAIALRDPHGGQACSAEAVRKVGRETREHAARLHAAEMAREAFRRAWKPELADLEVVPEVEDVSNVAGELVFGVTAAGAIRGIGPTYRLSRTGDGYDVSWNLEIWRMVEAETALGEVAAAVGARYGGRQVQVRLERLDRPSLLRLPEINAALLEAASSKVVPVLR